MGNCWSKCLYSCEKNAGAGQPSCFFSVQKCQRFLFKNKWLSRVRKTAFPSRRLEVPVSVAANIFKNYLQNILISESIETLKGFFTKFFGTLRPKIFAGKRDTAYYAQNFSIPQFFWNIEGMPMKDLRTVRPKFFRRKIVISPFSSIKLFEIKKFLKNSRVKLWKFSALWDTQILIENRDMPPLIHNFFSKLAFFLKNRKFPLQSFSFQFCETKKIDKTLKIYRYQISFETQKCSPTSFIVTVREKFFNGVWSYALLMQKFLRYTIFSETPKCSPTKKFGSVWQEILNENRGTHSFA